MESNSLKVQQVETESRAEIRILVVDDDPTVRTLNARFLMGEEST